MTASFNCSFALWPKSSLLEDVLSHPNIARGLGSKTGELGGRLDQKLKGVIELEGEH